MTALEPLQNAKLDTGTVVEPILPPGKEWVEVDFNQILRHYRRMTEADFEFGLETWEHDDPNQILGVAPCLQHCRMNRLDDSCIRKLIMDRATERESTKPMRALLASLQQGARMDGASLSPTWRDERFREETVHVSKAVIAAPRPQNNCDEEPTVVGFINQHFRPKEDGAEPAPLWRSRHKLNSVEKDIKEDTPEEDHLYQRISALFPKPHVSSSEIVQPRAQYGYDDPCDTPFMSDKYGESQYLRTDQLFNCESNYDNSYSQYYHSVYQQPAQSQMGNSHPWPTSSETRMPDKTYKGVLPPVGNGQIGSIAFQDAIEPLSRPIGYPKIGTKKIRYVLPESVGSETFGYGGVQSGRAVPAREDRFGRSKISEKWGLRA